MTGEMALKEGEGPSDPLISVLIIAHKKREYLFEAVSSVFASTLDHSQYEVLVVKPYEDPVWDQRLSSQGVRLVPCTAQGAGAKLATGCREARGTILAFLEDDDAFEREKLERVKDAFARLPDLIHYHHDQLAVDATGRTLGWVHGTPGFNMSSVAVKKNFVLDNLGRFEGLPAACDKMLYYTARISGLRMLHEGALLTRYRIHGANRHLGYDPTEDWVSLAVSARDTPATDLRAKLTIAYLIASSGMLLGTRMLLGKSWGTRAIGWYSWVLWFMHQHEVFTERPGHSHLNEVPLITPL